MLTQFSVISTFPLSLHTIFSAVNIITVTRSLYNCLLNGRKLSVTRSVSHNAVYIKDFRYKILNFFAFICEFLRLQEKAL